MAAVPQLPNPTTPMALLPPDLAFQVTISSYILVGSCGVLVWDLLDNITSDFRLLTKYRIGPATVIYFISRLGSLAYVLGSTIFETAAITHNCFGFDKVVSGLYPVAIAPTALLFLFRVRAVFDRNNYVIGFFTFMWFAVLAGCIAVTQGVTGANIGPTKYCVNVGLKPYAGAGGIIPVVNDTLVFLAISWRLLMNARVELDLHKGVKTFVFGDYLPAFSKAIFQDGQAYYLTTVTTNLVAVIMFWITAVPPTYRSMFTIPNIALMNIMACRVFRKTKFGIFRETAISTSHIISTRVTQGISSNSIPLHLRSGPKITKEVITDRDFDTIDMARSTHSGGNSKKSDWV
ncbi:hypothetical protein BJ165DRAFT_1602816 [Panaeolus papilionaceus]|nr:hypothetical protein BJ165DRAFT_1602816 [Panaeolus papilionaceus]